MTQAHWEALEKALAELSLAEKLELIERLAHSIRVEASAAPDRSLKQRENLDRLRKELAAMPASRPPDGLSNRDHDRILYGERS